MIYRIFKTLFLFSIVGVAAFSFQNKGLQVTVDNLKEDSNQFTSGFDIKEFTVLVYLLAILGYSTFILIYFVTKTREALLQGSLKYNINSKSTANGFY